MTWRKLWFTVAPAGKRMSLAQLNSLLEGGQQLSVENDAVDTGPTQMACTVCWHTWVARVSPHDFDANHGKPQTDLSLTELQTKPEKSEPLT